MNKQKDLSQILYDKSYECPVCGNVFNSKAIRLRKNQVISIDSDLYAHYSEVNPLFYDAIVCNTCGYSALSSVFAKIGSHQKKQLKEKVMPNYKERSFSEYTTSEEAITKHQLALVSSVVKQGKIGEQGYICLHIAWLYRDLEDTDSEKLYLAKAFESLSKAIETERFPIVNLDEITTLYILADIAFRLEDYVQSKQLVSQVLSSHPPSQLKNRALDLKDKLLALSKK